MNLQPAQRRLLGWLAIGLTGFALLWLASMPLISRQLIWGLEEQATALTPATIPQADAVVLLVDASLGAFEAGFSLAGGGGQTRAARRAGRRRLG